MKKLITSFAAVAILVSLATQSWASVYRLGSSTMTASADSDSYNMGSWTSYQDCTTYSGSNGAPRGFNLYELSDPGNYNKASLSCRQIQNDGTFADSYQVSSNFFNAGISGSTNDPTQTDMDKLPVGLTVAFLDINDTAAEFQFMEMLAYDIVAGADDTSSAYNSGADYAEEESSSITYHHINDRDYQYYTSIGGKETVMCDPGYVITAIRLQTDDAAWPYRGKVITDVEIKCTVLEERTATI